ncbi:antigen WC1.1-like [Lytechinus variegatus]|uniref:antigen WC1.1-like n=1 Tax=Lytechinus variegatus TaxID=7654 RepID=UPI001BB1A6CB|nr:antigen WC1.1-like [Lytechinus variegatus]
MDGLVVCKMLGYPFVVSVHVSAKFGMGSGDILLDDLSCTGTESSLESCSFAPVGTHNCMHHEDAGVTCSADSEFGGPARWTEMPLLSVPSGVGLPSNTLNMGIGSATILITLLVVVCVGCMFCACVMRRLRVNSNVETINNIRDNSCAVVNQRESTPASGDIIPPSYTDVLTRPNDYSQVNNAGDTTLPPQSPAPTSPPPSYARTFEVGNNTLRVITIAGPSSAREQRIRREPIPIPLSPPPSYDAVAPIFPSPDNARSGQSLPDVVTVLTDADERIALQDTLTESENTTVV